MPKVPTIDDILNVTKPEPIAPDDYPLWYGTDGPQDAEIVIVGEAWGVEEFSAKRPFVGRSGVELTRMLAEAGIDRRNCLVTNTIAERPYNNEVWRYFNLKKEVPAEEELRGLFPNGRVRSELRRLEAQIAASRRRLVITVGNYALWALTNHTGAVTSSEAFGRKVPNGIMDWRGSMTYTLQGDLCLPIIHPAFILRQWSLRAVTVHDLKARVPMALRGDWRPNPMPLFWAPPTFDQAKMKLEQWIARANQGRFRLQCDIETYKQRIITCIGLTDSVHFAMSIPFVKKVPSGLDSWWTLEQEVTLLSLLRRLLTHPNIQLEGQNFLYDTQYIQHWLLIRPEIDFDSMYAHHMLWPGTPKALDYLSSLYCKYHWYWKHESQDWDGKGTVEQLLTYNCWDLVRQFECATTLRELIVVLKMETQWQMTLDRVKLALRMMNRGVRIDTKRKGRLQTELAAVLYQIDTKLETIIPQSWLPPPKKGAKQSRWYTSSKQSMYVFGELLCMKLPRHRKTGNPTLGADEFPKLMKKHPEWTKLFKLLELRRSVAVFKSHFVDMILDPDTRARCSFNPSGTETFRYSSSANAFGRGTNLQNLPVGDEE